MSDQPDLAAILRRLDDLERSMKEEIAKRTETERHKRRSFWVSVAALLVSIGALLVVFETFDRQIHASAVGWILDVDEAFLERPYLRKHFHEGESIQPGAKDFDEALLMAEFMTDTFDAFLDQRSVLSWRIGDAWRTWMCNMVDRSPLLQAYVRDHEAWYTKGPFLNEVYLEWDDNRCQKLKERLKRDRLERLRDWLASLPLSPNISGRHGLQPGAQP